MFEKKQNKKINEAILRKQKQKEKKKFSSGGS